MDFVFEQKDGQKPIELKISVFFGKPPRTIIVDNSISEHYTAPEISEEKLQSYIENVLQVESVACKDWLTNKVDRSVTGKLPASNVPAKSSYR